MGRRHLASWGVPGAGGYWILRQGSVVRHEGLPEDFSGVLLYPFRTLSVHPFSYPFGNLSRIREALALQYRSLLLGGQGVEVLPTVWRREGKGASGVAWFWSREELAFLEGRRGPRLTVWPLPLALASQMEGDGAALWVDGGAVSSLAWRQGIPFLARWKTLGPQGLEGEKAWFRQMGGEAFSFVEETLDPRTPQEALRRLGAAADATWKAFPLLHEVDLSSGGVDALVAWDQALLSLRGPLGALLVGGLLFSGVQGGELWSALHRQEDLQARAAEAYAQVFGGTPTDPLSQARARLAEARGENRQARGASLGDVIRFVGETLSEGGDKMTLETLRYSASGAQMGGVLPDVGTLAKVKERLKKGELSSRVGDVQQTPDGQVRFTVEVGWQKP
ncbi:MAG TPA: type II secretion system protein GspL [Synergistaceae bacterium]|nr:type II secretion system protein GspL [Synergistaceae bacterium]HQH78355.1 type II secretion system protein GspL [Synergistaceae bacterium]